MTHNPSVYVPRLKGKEGVRGECSWAAVTWHPTAEARRLLSMQSRRSQAEPISSRDHRGRTLPLAPSRRHGSWCRLEELALARLARVRVVARVVVARAMVLWGLAGRRSAQSAHRPVDSMVRRCRRPRRHEASSELFYCENTWTWDPALGQPHQQQLNC